MKRSVLSQNSSSLIDSAISTLNPEVFAHPVWVRFGERSLSRSLSIADDLLSAAKNLQDGDPRSACQILLIAAFYQNYAGQRRRALQTADRAHVLAERSRFAHESVWAIWGGCAISIQERNYEQAGSHLAELQAVLGEQNEWVLANFVAELRESLFSMVPSSQGRQFRSPKGRPSEDSLALAIDWLQHWGLPARGSGWNLKVGSRLSETRAGQSRFSFHRWRGRWRSLILAFRGEIGLQWEVSGTDYAPRQISSLGSVLSSLRLYLAGRKVDAEVIDAMSHVPSPPILPITEVSSPPNDVYRKKQQVTKVEKAATRYYAGEVPTAVPVAVHMLGSFSISIGDLAVRLRASRGLSVLKYLLLHHQRPIPREVLMEVFWPDAEPETARNNLNVAMHSLRRALRGNIFLPVVRFEDGAYGLEPNFQVWLDVDEFDRCVKAGQKLEARDQLTAAITKYETAISLYQGDFLVQNPYEEWTILDRERLRIAHLDTLDRLSQTYFSQERYAACVTVCQLILTQDQCREDAHSLLMRCYSRQGQYYLAIRQYEICVEALRTELDLEPTQEMMQLFERVRRGERV